MSKNPLLLYRHPRRKTFLPDPDNENRSWIEIGRGSAAPPPTSPGGRVAMWDADHGTGAFYIIMDAVRQKIAMRKKEQREMEMRKKEEEAAAAAAGAGAVTEEGMGQ